MRHSTPKIRDLAGRLIALEEGWHKASGSKTPAAFHVCEKLRPYLATLAGKAGFRALLSRALAVASAEVLWLRAVQIEADGALGGWDDREAQMDPKEMTEGCVLLVAQLLALLVAFIGEDLTLQLVREAWPQLALNDLDNGDKNEKAN